MTPNQLKKILTVEEAALFDHLDCKESVSLDSLEEKYPGTARSGLIVRIKYLAAKIAPHGWIIERKSGIGRGAKGKYVMEKKF